MLDFSEDMIFRIPALLIAITVHEYAHAVTADSLGDPTPRLSGRMTLNPFAHLDIIGTLMLVLVGFGWAKPVEINTSYFQNYKASVRKVAFAGPASNFFLSFMATFLLLFLNKFNILTPGLYVFLLWLQLYNVWFAFFNLIPLPPLDGSRIVETFLSPLQAYNYAKIAAYSLYIMIALLLTGAIGFILRPLASVFLQISAAFLGIFF